MNALRTSLLRPLARQATQSRQMVSRTGPRLGGDGHVHLTFEPATWKPRNARFLVWGVVYVGTGATMFCVKFQQWKQGFPLPEED